MFRLLFKTFSFLCVCTLLFVGALVFFMDNTVKTAINFIGPKVVNTTAYVDNVNISIMDGRVELVGLNIGNMEGYSDESTLTAEKILIDLDLASLGSDKMIIEDLQLIGLSLNYEKEILGSSNLSDLMDQINSHATEASASKSDEAGGVQINRFLMDEGRLKMRIAGTSALGVSASLPRIELHDIGKESDGKSLAEASSELAKKVFGEADQLFAKNLGRLRSGIESVGDKLPIKIPSFFDDK